MRKSKLLTKVASIILACTMIVGSTGITTLAETGHTAYENIKECNVTVEPVIVEEVVEPNEVVYADAASDMVTYRLYNNKSYEVINKTYTDVVLKTNSSIDRKIFECAVYEPDGLCTSIYKSSYILPTIRNGSGKEERAVVTINNKNAGEDYYVEVSLPKEVVVEESESPALYHYTLNNHESCTIVNPTNRDMQVKGETSDICNDALEYVIYDSKGFCTKHDLDDWHTPSSLGAYSRGVVTLNYRSGDTYMIDLAIPYEYFKDGAEIKVSEEPAFYIYTLNNHKSCVINNKTERNVELAHNLSLDYVFDYAKYTASVLARLYLTKYFFITVSFHDILKETAVISYGKTKKIYYQAL